MRQIRALLTAIALVATGCTSSTTAVETASAQVTGLGAIVAIDGRASAPTPFLSNNGSALISNNGGGLITDGGSGIVASNSSRLRLLSVDEQPLANALAYLTTPSEDFYRFNGKAVVTTTDGQGRYHFAGGVPKKEPVIVSVILPGNRRVVGFTVPDTGTAHLDVSLATTLVTEFLRLHAQHDKKSMADYSLDRLPDLAARTQAALDKGEMALPDLAVGLIPAMDQQYALAVGKNLEGLGDAWAKMLGYRVIAADTVAGTGVTDYDGDGGPARQAAFYRLKGVAVDHAGNIFLADEGNHAVREIDATTGVITTIAGTGERGYAGDGGPATRARLCFPRSVALDRQENLYIFDSQNVRVRRVDKATGIITTIAGNPTSAGNGIWTGGWGGDGGPADRALLFSPRNGAFDSQGNLFVGDGLKGTNFNTIREITGNGVISTFAGVPNSAGAFEGEDAQANKARFNYTNQLFMTPNDELYMADTNNHCVRKIDLSTNLVTTVAGIPGKAADPSDPDGLPATQARLNAPYGVAVDGKGQIFISERGLPRVMVVKTNGKLYTLAGGGRDTGDGDARAIALDEPHDICLDHDGNLLMCDARAAKLRRFYTRFGL